MEISEIYQVFKDYFGEAYVDIQQNSNIVLYSGIDLLNKTVILVHWPTVKVTNEYDQSIEIWDLYGATVIDTSTGKLEVGPNFNRSTYDKVQWDSNYLHSHVPSIDKTRLTRFQDCCLGSGPIRNTIEKLRSSSGYSDLDVWNLYCWELDKYVTVESLQGVPYKKLMDVGKAQSQNDYSDIFIRPALHNSHKTHFKFLINTLIKYIVSHNVLQYAYKQGIYTLATNVTDTVLNISNAFIEMYNSDNNIRLKYPIKYLTDNYFIKTNVIINGYIYNKLTGNRNIEAVLGTKLFTFKGKDVYLKLKNQQQDYTSADVTLIDKNIIDYIIYKILKYINLKYGRTAIISDKKVRVI